MDVDSPFIYNMCGWFTYVVHTTVFTNDEATARAYGAPSWHGAL